MTLYNIGCLASTSSWSIRIIFATSAPLVGWASNHFNDPQLKRTTNKTKNHT